MDSSAKVYGLPLFELFTQLHRAGLPLGLDEYQELLRALQGGFGVPDRAALARLCKTLWVKSVDEERLFDHQFEQVLSQAKLRAFPQAIAPATAITPRARPLSPTSKPETIPAALAATPAKSPSTPATTATLPLDEVQVAKAVLQAANRNDDSAYSSFIQTDEYFPITRRQMKQSWRYLRRPVREGPPVELDIKSTIEDIGRQGILLQPVLLPRRTNRTQLLLLIDRGGSMVPFHSLSRRLAETAVRGGRLGKTDIYYFHNCPTEYLYNENADLDDEPLQDILNRLHFERTGVLIFSDAGAARGGLNPERVELTEQFLKQLKQRVHYAAWLNPMPRLRWHGTTASKIMQNIPMFDLSRRGLDDAIRVLRGHPVFSTSIEVRA